MPVQTAKDFAEHLISSCRGLDLRLRRRRRSVAETKRAIAHTGDDAPMSVSWSGGFQLMSSTVDANGNVVTSISRFDINPNNAHVQKLGPHLNLETQINGATVRSGPLADPHTPIDPTTIRPGDIP